MAERSRGSASSTATRKRRPDKGPEDAAQVAREKLRQLISHGIEGVSAVERTDDGWLVSVDVLEVPRIPDTTSLLATYEVHLEPGGALLDYRRSRRYRRGAADE
ncbi:gas vesicle protein [Streptomyces sp. PTM05]|uniref:Gas vesicle protein n=1 Tax=Streptantibioticus parmotrematis TaxID=2873249 RepID=A0ABS7R4L4_9ACTN|nr:gas vesicle protein GvpO [Streptantibioticus parmotrematis]MBY8888989.1 gas vesicle protein [Streptantibioticus parmotrematis]